MKNFYCSLKYKSKAKELAIPVCIANPQDPERFISDCIGIIDTGATSSMISADLAEQLELEPYGTISISGVHGTENAKLFRCDIIFGSDYILPGHSVSAAEGDAGFDLLIGMDILTMGEMYVSNQAGKTFFRFGIPVF